MVGTSEIKEEIHRKTLDENKHLFTTGPKILLKGLLSDGISCQFFLPIKEFVKLCINNANHQNK